MVRLALPRSAALRRRRLRAAARSRGDRAQAPAHFRREVARREAPAPVALSAPGQVHAPLGPHAEHVLQRHDRGVGHRRAGEQVVAAAEKGSDWSGPEPGQRADLKDTVGALRGQGYEFATDLPATAPAMAFALESDAESTAYWIGFHNFRVITRYNTSVKYALAAYELGQAIRDGHERTGATGAAW